MERIKAVIGEPFYATQESFQWLLSFVAQESKLDYDKVKSNYQAGFYKSEQGQKVIHINGMIFRYSNFLTEIGYATSSETVKSEIAQSINDGDDVLLVIDSGGGLVNGISDLADFIYANRKKCTAFVKGTCASGAFWLASACSKVYAEKTSIIGSVGVVVSAVDYKKYFEKIGITIKDITSTQSPNKRPDVTTDEGENEVRRNLDSLANIFISSVAKYRNMGEDEIIIKLENGGVITGQEAVDRGVITGIKTLGELLIKVPDGAHSNLSTEETMDKKEVQGASAPETTQEDLVALKKVNQKLEAIANYANLLTPDEQIELSKKDISANDVKDFVINKAMQDAPKPAEVDIKVGDDMSKKRVSQDAEDAIILGCGLDIDASDNAKKLASRRSFKPIIASITGLDPFANEREYSAAMSTSDFPVLLKNAVSRVLEDGFERAETTYRKFVNIVEHKDFKDHNAVYLGNLSESSWKDVKEGGEIKYTSLSENSSTSKLETKGLKIALTRQMIINDDLSAFSNLVSEIGESADLLINELVYAYLERRGKYASAVLGDGKALFHADHKNIASTAGAPTETTLSAMRTMMTRQVDAQGEKIRVMPRHIIVPVELQDAATKLMVSSATLEANKNSGVKNVYERAYNVISDPAIENTFAWYLLANKAINLGVLAGTGGRPIVEMVKESSIDGLEYAALIDFSIYASRYQYSAKNAGQ